MKNAPLAGLLYREYYIGKKYIRISFLGSLAFALIMTLILLSFEYGNLRMIDETIREDMYKTFTLLGKYFPIFGFCTISECMMEVTVKLENTKYKRFRLSTPVSGMRFSAAKHLFILMLSVFSIVLCAVYLFLFKLLFKDQVTIGSWGVVFLSMAYLNLVGILMQVYGILFESLDKAGIALCITLMIPIMCYFIFNKKGAQSEIMPMDLFMQKVESFGAKALPYAVVVLLLTHIIGFIITGLLYQRREK